MADQPTVVMSKADKQKLDEDAAKWRRNLILLGFGMVALMICLEVLAMSQGTKVTEDKTVAGKTVTTTDGAALPAALITTCLGGAVLLFLGGAFYGRITKVSWNGVEVDLGAQAEKAVEKKADAVARETNQDPQKAEELKELAKAIAKGTNLVTTLTPDALAESSVRAAAHELNIM